MVRIIAGLRDYNLRRKHMGTERRLCASLLHVRSNQMIPFGNKSFASLVGVSAVLVACAMAAKPALGD